MQVYMTQSDYCDACRARSRVGQWWMWISNYDEVYLCDEHRLRLRQRWARSKQ